MTPELLILNHHLSNRVFDFSSERFGALLFPLSRCCGECRLLFGLLTECVAGFDARDTLVKGLTVFTAMLRTVTFRKDVMEKGASGGFTNATDCADYLVKRGVPFRDAHAVVGRLVAHCLNENKALLDLSLEELKQFHPAFEADVFDDLSMLSCVEKRRIPGAPAPDMVQAAIDEGRKSLEENA